MTSSEDTATPPPEEKKEHVPTAEELCTRIEELCKSDRLVRAMNKVKEIQTKWEELSKDGNEEFAKHAARYKKAEDTFFKIYRQHLENEEWERWANYQKKTDLRDLAAKLNDEQDLAKVAQIIKDVQAKWKKVGPVPHRKSENLWQEFKKICDQQFARCQPYFEELDKNRDTNFDQKVKLCEEAEALSGSTKWRETGDKLKAIQARWKEVGPVPRGKDKMVFPRFKKACDAFFKAKSAHYKGLEGRRDDNLKDKLALVEEVNAINTSKDWAGTAAKIKQIQDRWRDVGPVPRDKDKEVWDAFRSACDVFYEALDDSRKGNLRAKEEVLEQAQGLISAYSEENDDLEIVKGNLKNCQRKFTALPVGPRVEDKALGDKFFKMINDFFKNAKSKAQRQEEENHKNNAVKAKLVDQMMDALFIEDLNAAQDNIKKLQADFKAVPATENDGAIRKVYSQVSDYAASLGKEVEASADEDHKIKSLVELCMRMEMLHGNTASEDSSLSLAERMRIALQAKPAQTNRAASQEETAAEAKKIKQTWVEIGPVSNEKSAPLKTRMLKAIDALK